MSNELKKVLPPKIYEDAMKELKKVPDNKKDKAIKRIIEYYNKTKFEAGEAVGVVAAQSLSEPATQMTMRTYHIAGAIQIEVRKGLPRLIEIFDARRVPSTPTMAVYLKKKFNTKDKALTIASSIKEILLRELAESSTIDIANQQVEVTLTASVMKEYGTNVSEVLENLQIVLKTLKLSSKRNVILGSYKKDVSIKELQKLKTKLLKTHVKGLKGIKHAIINQSDNGEWVINTLGSNLKDVLEMTGVDGSRTVTNNIHEIAKVLGIEAARQVVMEEASSTIKDQGLDVDIRHIMLVSDMMTAYGEIKAIGRYGIAGSKGSVLARANFEETVKHLTNASIKKEVDNLDSIVENVMINQVVPIGTGMFDLILKRKAKK
jgi:DNA-directed RNA polymerase subunit A''